MELASLRHVIRYSMKYGLCGGTYDLINSRVRIDFKKRILTLDLVRVLEVANSFIAIFSKVRTNKFVRIIVLKIQLFKRII